MIGRKASPSARLISPASYSRLLLTFALLTLTSALAFAQGQTTFTSSFTNHTTFTRVDLAGQRVDTFATQVTGRLVGNGVVFDQTFALAFGDPVVQQAVLDASAALEAAAAPLPANIAGPNLLSSLVSLAGSQTDSLGDQFNHTEETVTLEQTIGPGTIIIGDRDNGGVPFEVRAGTVNFNDNTHTETFIDQRFQTTDTFLTTEAYELVATTVSVSTLDHFLGYKTRPPQGSRCGQDAPKRKGKACEIEEECGGYEDDDRDLETGCCVPAGFPRDRQVALADRFETKRFDVKKPLSLYNPADKDSEGVHDPETHLRSYRIKPSHTQPPQPQHLKHKLRVGNQFGELLVTTITPKRLLVPTAKSLTGPVDPPDPEAHDLDHFKCYQVKITKDAPEFPEGLQVVAVDQFNQPKRYDLRKPKQVCVAADKNGEGLKNPDAGLMCYRIKPAEHEPKHVKLRGIHINNQLGPERFDTVKDDELCVPSEITDLGIVTH